MQPTSLYSTYRPWLLALALVVVTFSVYRPVWQSGFIFDDSLLITNNEMVKARDGLYRFWLTTEAPDYYPLTSTLWWLEWRFWGNQATGYHVVNVLLHAVNAVLVCLALRRLKVLGAWLAGLVFAIHPVNVASVAWISEQKNTLSMLFYLLTIVLYLRFDEASRQHGTFVWAWYLSSLGAFLLALLSKSAVVMLPIVLLGCIWWLHGNIRQQDLLRSVPFFALSLALGVVTVWFQYKSMGPHAVRSDGFALRLAAAGWVPWFYLYKALLPLNLMVVYPKWGIDASRWASYLPGLALVGCLALFWWNRRGWGRPLVFGLGCFVVMLFPVLGFFDQAFYRVSLVADHWQYYSIVGVIALAAAAARTLPPQRGDPSWIVAALAGSFALFLLGIATWNRSSVYADNKSLWQDNLARDPNSWAAHTNLGYALAEAGRVQEAIGHYEQALLLNPDFAETHYSLGIALLQTGKTGDAVEHLKRALQLGQNFAGIHNNLGVALLRTGRTPEAIEHLQQAIRMKPDYADAHINLGVAMSQTANLPAAIQHYRQALAIKPDMAEAHYHLGVALLQTGRPGEAIAHFDQVLRIKPDVAEAQNNLAWLLATLTPAEGGNPGRAVDVARRACELTDYRVAGNIDTLAVAYAADGRFGEAVAAGQRAIELARATEQPQLVREMESRLEIYRSGRAYRESPNVTSQSNP